MATESLFEATPVPSTLPSPIEATLRILQSSVPHLTGVAVIRQGGNGTVAAQLGRVPWLFDRRLTQLELSDDGLPSNEAVLLDWPVPHQAEWLGAAPRLLIARLVAAEKTLGLLLGTLITRDQLDPKTREAIELSCQLLAAAVATERLARDSEQQARRLQILNELQRALSSSLDARELGRVLRDAMGFVLEHIGFAVSLFHPQRAEVAYRYRVVDHDALPSESARRPLDDGPACPAAQRGERVAFTREIELELDGGRTMRRTVHVAQFPLVSQQTTIGVATVQAVRPDGFSDDELTLATTVVETSANYFAHARRAGVRGRGPNDPRLTLVAGTRPVEPTAELRAARQTETPEETPEPALPTPPPRSPDEIMSDLLKHLAALGSPHAFAVVSDDDGAALRGHSVSDWTFMRELDRAVGITSGEFSIALEDRANAIARACREGRVASASWLFEVLQPALTWQESLELERSAGGGRCTIVPLIVADHVAGAVVAGPGAEVLSTTTVRQLAARVEAAAEELSRLVRERSASAPVEPRLTAIRQSGLLA